MNSNIVPQNQMVSQSSLSNISQSQNLNFENQMIAEFNKTNKQISELGHLFNNQFNEFKNEVNLNKLFSSKF